MFVLPIGIARRHEPRDDERAALGLVGERGAGGRRRRPGDVDVVLDRERDAVQRQVRRDVAQARERRLDATPRDERDPRRLLARPRALVGARDDLRRVR
jgi:hypothetical protein